MIFKKVMLYSNNLEQQKEFYTKTLGFELKREEADFFVIQTGITQLRFVKKEGATPYHFAFNIPSNKGADGVTWLKERVQVLDFEGAELVDFTDWNAEAMYFYDADNNIVEFIARKNLNINTDALFLAKQVLSLSEVGLPTSNVQAIYDSIQQHFSIQVYSGDLIRFSAMGDEQGLFIVIDDQVKKWIPRNDFPHRSAFEVELEFEGESFELSCENGRVVIKK